MKETFLRHLDSSTGQWEIDVFERRDHEIWTGIVSNESGTKYPVIEGIPRLLRGEWLARCLRRHPEFSNKYGGRFVDRLEALTTASPGEALKLKTVDNFSYEWKRFHRMLPIYETNHSLYFHPRGKEFFAGKLGLDAGCGTGRHVYYAAKYGAEMVAIDLSDAAEVAYQNTRSLKNVHVAQADIFDLPFKRNYFDFVESIGVIHILPDPKAAFDGLVELLRPGGEIFIYVYSSNLITPVNRLEAIKMSMKKAYERIGRMLPARGLYAYCFLAAAIGRTWNVPWRLLQKWESTRSLANRWMAFDSYEIYPFYVLHTDLFDWIGTPLNRYYTLDDIRSFYIGGPFDCVEIQEADPQWRVFARKAPASGLKFSFDGIG
jgi:SAM-dependent methyltransferase/uncharacterized protein YbaR (Trm112 family)